jgi:hypothetical protein
MDPIFEAIEKYYALSAAMNDDAEHDDMSAARDPVMAAFEAVIEIEPTTIGGEVSKLAAIAHYADGDWAGALSRAVAALAMAESASASWNDVAQVEAAA